MKRNCKCKEEDKKKEREECYNQGYADGLKFGKQATEDKRSMEMHKLTLKQQKSISLQSKIEQARRNAEALSKILFTIHEKNGSINGEIRDLASTQLKNNISILNETKNI